MKEMIVSFLHSNYGIQPAGTEKFVRGLSKILQQEGYAHLNFFPIHSDKTTVGVYEDDRFQGLFPYREIGNIIAHYAHKRNAGVKAVHIHHLWHHDPGALTRVIRQLKAPVYLILHDYYFICSRFHLTDQNNRFCGVSAPSREKCKDCAYAEQGAAHFEEMGRFLREISPWLTALVAPSAFVAEGFARVYPQLQDRIAVRPHLKLQGSRSLLPVTGKIRLGYVGAQAPHKGYEQWKALVKHIQSTCPDAYELFYFGSGTDNLPGVQNRQISIGTHGENAMVEQLRQADIHCAFAWSTCAETYSYVYYELAICGVYVVSNPHSGNIAAELIAKENGKVFEDERRAQAWFSNPEQVLADINRYRQQGAFRPETAETNTDISLLLPENPGRQPEYKAGSVGKKLFKTALYRLKHRRHFMEG